MKYKLLLQLYIMSGYTIKILLIQCICCTVLLAETGKAQKSIEEYYITVQMQDVKLKHIFTEIEMKTPFSFAFTNNIIEGKEKLSLDFENESLGNLLRYISKNSALGFKRIDNTIHVNVRTGSESEVSETLIAEVEISGKVTDENGQGLPGVSILVKGTTKGTTTDLNGNYRLNVPENSILVFSYVGYLVEEISIADRTVIDIIMVFDAAQLDEIVVTGYTSQSKRSITGAIETVDPAEMAKNPSTSIEQKLQGQVSGVSVITSGRPGAATNVRIRGFGTTGDNNPLYVIDGIPSPIGVGLNEINPNDVESISVIKDASAASIYGSRGANGVVLITTKRGMKNQAAKITYNSYFSVDIDPGKQDVLNAQQWADMEFQGQAAAGLIPTHPTLGTGTSPVIPEYLNGDPSLPYDVNTNRLMRSADTDWYDAVTGTGFSQNHNLSIAGGGENSRFGVSFGYLNREGSIIHTSFDRYSTRINVEFSALNDRLRIGENVSVTYSERFGGGLGSRHSYNPIIPVYDEGGDFGGTLNGVLGLGTNQQNPVAVQARRKGQIARTLRTFGNAYLEFDILPELTYKTSIGINYRQRNNSNFSPEFTEGGNPGNSLSEFSGWDTNVIWTNTLNFSKDFEDHTIGVLIGSEAIETKSQFAQNNISNFFSEDPSFAFIDGGSVTTLSASGSGSQRNLSSLFAKADYSYKNKYLMNVTVRRDGSSALGPNNRFDVFPAFGVGWIISDESFLADYSFLNLLKIRAGWGTAGNQNSLTDFAFASRFGQNVTSTGYDLSASNGTPTAGVGLLSQGNADLVWESSETINVGLDFSLLEDKISGSVEWYNKTTKDLIVAAPLPLTSGVASPPFTNIGEIENKGLDLSLRYSGNVGDLRLGITGIVSTYKNKVIDLDGNPETFIDGRFGNPNIPASRTQAGQELSAFYGLIVDGVIQSGVDAGNFDFRDLNSDDVIDPNDDQEYIGSPHPDFTYSLNINAEYKNFDFTVFFRGSQGNDIWNATKTISDFQFRSGSNRSTRVLNAWRPDNPTNELAEYNLNTATFNLQSSSYYVEDGSYLKLQTLQLGYTFPGVTGLDNLRLYVQAQNLLTVTDYSGVDPEIQEDSGSLDKGTDTGGTYAVPRSFLLGINVRF